MPNIRGCAHILFTRMPLPGAVKTRLAPVLSPEQRAAFQEALIIDTAAKLLELDGTVVLCCSDEQRLVSGGEELFESFVERIRDACDARQHMRVMRQKGDDLGERMSNALEDAFRAGADACLLMGSDLPCITAADVSAAERLLDRADIVLGPSSDGGYWLVGMKTPFPELFENERYGRDDVLEHALAICKRHNKTVAFAPPSSDVDTPADYELLRRCVAAGDTRIGPCTAKAVKCLSE